jgi:hypothetical protein
MSDDAMIERVTREEQDELDRTHGQHILDVTAAQGSGEDPVLELLQQAHQAKADQQ